MLGGLWQEEVLVLGDLWQGGLVESGPTNTFLRRPSSWVLAKAPPPLTIVPTWPIHDEQSINILNKDRIQGWGQGEVSAASGISAGQILLKGVASWKPRSLRAALGGPQGTSCSPSSWHRSLGPQSRCAAWDQGQGGEWW